MQACGNGEQSGCLGVGVWCRKKGSRRSMRKCFGVMDALILIVMMLSLHVITDQIWCLKMCGLLYTNYTTIKLGKTHNCTLKRINTTTCKLSLNDHDLKRAYGKIKYGVEVAKDYWKPVSKDDIQYDSIYIILSNDGVIEMENRLVVAQGWGWQLGGN